MITAVETKENMKLDPQWWKVPFLDFVDDFRRNRDIAAIAEPFVCDDEKQDALIAATIETLCDEMRIVIPGWVREIPGCEQPYFPSKMDSLNAISIVESPVRFRLRNIFVLENALHRV